MASSYLLLEKAGSKVMKYESAKSAFAGCDGGRVKQTQDFQQGPVWKKKKYVI